MKILITGMNKLQCTEDFYASQQLKVVPSHYSLIRCLRDMGHEVEQRVVNIGENLDKYDKVIVYIHNPSGFAAYVYNALYTIARRRDCTLAFDDWQTDSIYSGLLALRDPEKLFRKYVLESHTNIPENVTEWEKDFIEALDIIQSKTNNLLISAFRGGDPTLLLDYPRDKIFTYNPNPYHLNRKPNNLVVEPKQRIFNFAGLIQDKTKKWLKAQGINDNDWPLMKYGSRKDGQDRVTEDVMVNIYAEHWGILMPGYFHAGSGWWRARPLQVADAGSILIGDPDEMFIYYEDEALADIKAKDLVDMCDKELEDLAAAQREALYRIHPLNKETQKAELNLCLKS
ncbi:hypothetical protein [uncultured phage]|nr:hypothetical protein [uncultured phage]